MPCSVPDAYSYFRENHYIIRTAEIVATYLLATWHYIQEKTAIFTVSAISKQVSGHFQVSVARIAMPNVHI